MNHRKPMVAYIRVRFCPIILAGTAFFTKRSRAKPFWHHSLTENRKIGNTSAFLKTVVKSAPQWSNRDWQLALAHQVVSEGGNETLEKLKLGVLNDLFHYTSFDLSGGEHNFRGLCLSTEVWGWAEPQATQHHHASLMPPSSPKTKYLRVWQGSPFILVHYSSRKINNHICVKILLKRNVRFGQKYDECPNPECAQKKTVLHPAEKIGIVAQILDRYLLCLFHIWKVWSCIWSLILLLVWSWKKISAE